MEFEGIEAIAAGRVAKTFGLNGELAVTLYEPFTYETNEEPVYVQIDDIWTPLFFHSFRPRGKNKATVVFEDLDTEYRASELVGREFYLFAEPEERDPDDDELYLEDLTGYAVRFEGHENTGTITGFIESEFNPLFEIDLDGEEVLIPAADDFIVEISQKQRLVTMNIPDGLLEL